MKYSAKDPESGEIYTQNSKRNFTHATITKFQTDKENEWRGGTQVNFHGSEKLAKKKASAHEQLPYVIKSHVVPLEVEE